VKSRDKSSLGYSALPTGEISPEISADPLSVASTPHLDIDVKQLVGFVSQNSPFSANGLQEIPSQQVI
jgi:hypothetical protein